MTLPNPRNSSVCRNSGTEKGKEITVLHTVVTVRSTSMILMMTALPVRGEAAAHVMIAVSHLLALVSVIVIEVHLMIGLPQGVMI